MSIVEVALPVPLRDSFDYRIKSDATILPGSRLKVPFGKRQLIGFALDTKSHSAFADNKLKDIDALIDEQLPLLPDRLLSLMRFAAHYYHAPIGEVMMSSIPKKIKQGEIWTQDILATVWRPPKADLPVNEEQQAALDALLPLNSFKSALLEGVTGSGKTQIYLQLALTHLQRPTQILMMIPEISLSPQTTSRFQAVFGDHVYFFHSQMTEKQRLDVWMKARTGQPGVYIGTRSALFLPLTHLSLIMVDEEHDSSYKQHEGFRYHARDLAIKHAQINDVPVVLGSATPSILSRYQAEQGNYLWLRLTKRANDSQIPPLKLVKHRWMSQDDFISSTLLAAMKKHLENGHQVLLFINRRGYAPILICEACNECLTCARCDQKLVFHQSDHKLHCHLCQKVSPKPEKCPNCQAESLRLLGAGTERIADTLAEKFEDTPVIRIDSDTTRKKGSLADKLDSIHQGKPCIILGTQILAKGHDFPHVTLACILDVDAGLFSVDYNAEEQTGQLILQVAGRAGRGMAAGEVYCQTQHPDNPLLQCLVKHDYQSFIAQLMLQRQTHHLPPFGQVALFRCQALKQQDAYDLLLSLKTTFEAVNTEHTFLGPSPAPIAKKQGKFQCQFLILSPDRKSRYQLISHMIHWLSQIKRSKARWSIDIDPIDLS